MKIVGILTEFNPFHNGHAYFLSELRRQLGENAAILCVMSGNFVQRGEPAMFPKHVRAEAALLCGADLIIELPVARSLASAERFARGAVYLMQCLGCVTHLAFGSECGDVAALQRVADCLDSERCRAGLRRFLDEGMSFAACRQAAVREVLGERAAALLDGANNNLGVEYLRAARYLKWDCTALTVARRGAGHDSGAVKGEYLSASAVRKLLEQGDWAAAAAAVPLESLGRAVGPGGLGAGAGNMGITGAIGSDCGHPDAGCFRHSRERGTAVFLGEGTCPSVGTGGLYRAGPEGDGLCQALPGAEPHTAARRERGADNLCQADRGRSPAT